VQLLLTEANVYHSHNDGSLCLALSPFSQGNNMHLMLFTNPAVGCDYFL